jgi:hypothetical protein
MDTTMKKTLILGLCALSLVLAQPVFAKPSITKLVKKGGRVVTIDSASDPKNGKETTRVWIQAKKRLWMCFVKDKGDSYCIVQD